MNRTLYILLLCLYTISGYTQAHYTVFEIKGSPSLKKRQEWQPLKKKQEVSAIDFIKVGKSESVTLLETQTNLLYTIDIEGEKRISGWIATLKRNQDNLTSQTNNHIRKEAREKGTPTLAYSAFGGSSRNKNNQYDLTDSIHSVLWKIIQDPSVITSDPTFTEELSFTLIEAKNRKTSSSSSLKKNTPYYLTVQNSGKQLLCFNILVLYPGKQPTLLLDPGYACDEPYLLINAESTIDLSYIPFVTSEAPSSLKFILFGFPAPFDNGMLRKLLPDSPALKDVEFSFPLPVTLKNFKVQ